MNEVTGTDDPIMAKSELTKTVKVSINALKAETESGTQVFCLKTSRKYEFNPIVAKWNNILKLLKIIRIIPYESKLFEAQSSRIGSI